MDNLLTVRIMNQFFYQSNSIDKSKKLMKTTLLNWFSDCSFEVVAKNRAPKIAANFLASFWAVLSLFSNIKTQNRYAMVVCRAFVGVMFLTLVSSFKTVAALPDLSVSTSVSNQSPAVGTDITYTVKITNINPDKATGVELTDVLPQGVTFKSLNVNGVGSATTSTTSGITSVIWNVGEVAGSTAELTMTIVATVTQRGFWYNTAEITKETEQDTDSTPNNHLILEDDQDATCFSIEEYFYNGDEYTTSLPTGFTNIIWTKKVGVSGTPTVVTSTTSGVTLLPDGNIRITAITDYTEFAFTANNGRCPVNGCCAIKFIPGAFGSIGSVVWSDVDGNGIRNTGEAGLNGITVELYDATDNTLLATDVTADGGRYLFSDLMSGSYKVKFILPSGRTFVTPNAPGSNVNNDSDAGTGGFTNNIAIDVTKPTGDVGRDNLTIGAGLVSDCIIGTGTLTATNTSLCLPAAGGTVVLTGTTGVSPTVPTNYSVSYILTKGTTNTIQQISSTPSFTVGLPDDYKIFTLVYDANSANSNFLNLSSIIFGVTKASDLETTINTSGKCAQLDAIGVGFTVKTTLAAPFILGTTVCAGGTVTIGTPGVTNPIFQWFTSATATTPFATTSSITVSPTQTTTYFLSIVSTTGSACPSEKASVEIAVTPKPTTPSVIASIANNCAINATTVNLADAITSTVSAGGTFEWHTANSTSSAVISNPTAIGAGTYFLFEKSSNGCYSDGAMVVVNINSCQCTNPPVVSLTALLPICGGVASPVQLNAILSGGAISGVWTTDGTGTFDNANSLTAKYTPSAADMTDGSIVLTFTSNDPDGAVSVCNAAVANTILTIKAKPVAPLNLKSDTLICLGSSTKLFAVSAGNTIKWYTSATSTTAIGIGSDLGFAVSPTSEGTFTYFAEATSPEGCVSDRTSISFKVKKCFTDLAVVKTVITSPDASTSPSYLLGQEIAYTIDARNIGTLNSNNVTVTDLLPQGATFVSAIPTGQYNSTTGVWNVGSLSEGSNKILLINVRLTRTGSIANTATITGTEDDPNSLANNTSTATVTVTQRADLSLVKTVSNLTPNVGDTLTYTLTVSNAGPNVATNVEIKDIIPAGLTFISSTNTTHTSGVITGTIASIPVGSSQVFTYRARVVATGTITSAAEVTKSDQPDPDSTPANGTANNEDDRSSVTIVATELCNLVAPVITSDKTTVCLGQAITLTATGCVGTIRWSDGSTGSPKTILPSANVTFTATCESGVCTSPTSNGLSFVVNTTSTIAAPVAINTSIATGTTADLTRLVTSSTPTGTILVFRTTNSPISNVVLAPTAVSVGTYFAFYQSVDGCYSAGTRIIVDNGNTSLEADVAIKIEADRTSAKLDENINFLISVTNNGPNTARNLVITNPLPAGLTFVSSSTGLTISGGQILINLDSLERGQVKTFAYVAKMKVTTTVVNPASVTSFRDSNLTNNNSSVTINGENTGVDCKIGLAMSVADTSIVRPGVYNVRYRLIAKNFCSDTLKNISLTSSLASTFKSPVTVTVIQNPTLGRGSRLVVNNGFSLLDSNLVNKATSLMLPNAVDTITYVVQVVTGGNTGPYNSQALITGTRPNTEVLTAKSSDGTNVNATPSITKVPLGPPNTIIGLAKELVATGLKRDSANVWTVPYRIRVVNMGAFDIKKLSVKDSLDGVFTFKGAVLLGKPVVTSTKAGITINPNYTGKGTNTNLLVDSLSTLLRGDSAIINLTVRVNVAAATDSVFNNVAVGIGLGVDNKSYTDVSTNGVSPDVNKDANPNNDNVATPVILKKENGLNSQASIGLALAAVTDTVAQSDGSYNVTLTLVAKNYGPVLLNKVALSNDLETTIGKQVGSWTILGRPTMVRGVNAVLNTTFNGRRDTVLTVAENTALAVGDSIVITYVVNVTKPLIDTLFTFAHAKAVSVESTPVDVTDSSVNGANPDPNKDGKPLESSPTPMVFPKKVTVISIPHGFSPNGDGVNDTFVIDGVNADERANLEVYNRWGSLVYASTDYKNDWNGMPNTGLRIIEVGDGLPSGTYFYVVTVYKRVSGDKVVLPVNVEPVRYMTISR
eukprot:GDKJ01004577.1.p1 GENE.GDKJ01004577.1~~GDKJ01004577.1.p1  ORF type:complete len:2063 (+),score=134.68 GDKJ01004577.1:1736-7924(+)